MSGDAMKRVQRGEPLELEADAWNRMLTSTEWSERQRRNGSTGEIADPLLPGMAYIRNDSGQDRERFSVLAITGVRVEPTTTESVSIFNEEWSFIGETPASNQTGKFAVLAEAIEFGRIGRAYIDGVFPAFVSFHTTDFEDPETNFHQYADVVVGENYLRSMGGGAAQILYRAKVADPDRVLLRISPGFQTGIGNAGEDISKGSAGLISVKSKLNKAWPLSAGSESFNGVEINAYARMADIHSGDQVIWAWTDGVWEVWQVECNG